MAKPSRYNVSDEDAGVESGILKNKLGITVRTELEDTETVLLVDTYEHFFSLLEKSRLAFDTSLLLQIHREFLETLYDWAAKKLGVIHNEFNAVHPFREGNGRTIRLFLDLLAVSVGYATIDYGRSTDDYIAACAAGMNGDDTPMTHLIEKGLKYEKKTD